MRSAILKLLLIVATSVLGDSFSWGSESTTGNAQSLKAPIEDLIKQLGDNSARVRRKSVKALAGHGKAAVPALIKAAKSGSYRVKIGSVNALGAIGPAARDAVPVLIERLHERGNMHLSVAAANALGNIGPAAANAAPDLLRHLAQDWGFLPQHIAPALEKLGPNAAPHVRKALDNADIYHGIPSLVAILAHYGPKHSLPLLKHRLPRVRIAACRELSTKAKAFFAVPTSVAADAKPTISAIVELRDGSRLVGQTTPQDYSFVRDDGKKLRLSSKQTVGIEADDDRELFTVQLGDRTVRGDVQWKQLEISGVFGTVKVPFDQVTRIQFVQPKLGLIAHFRFDGDCRDSSGNNNHGKPHDDVKFLKGKLGKAASFDGTGDYISVVPKSDVSKIADFTVSAWVFIAKWKNQPSPPGYDKQFVFDGITDPNRRVLTSGPGWFTNGFSLSCHGGSNFENIAGYVCVDKSNFRWYVYKCTGQLAGQWRLVTITRKQNREFVYLDGKLLSARQASSRGATKNRPLNMKHTWHIGTYAANDPNSIKERGFRYGFLGRIDDLRIYNRALDPHEVRHLATGKSQQ